MSPAEFVVHEAQLLDERRHDEWLALFTDDGRYWVPLLGAAQVDGEPHNALADDDLLLLKLRVERLKGGRAHSQRPPSRCQHVLQASTITLDDGERADVRTPFVYVESRGERQLMLAGTTVHRLVKVAGEWRIRLKRVDLLDAGTALPMIQLFP